MRTKRMSNFELLRIIAMMMIVFSHFVQYGLMRNGYQGAFEIWYSQSVISQLVTSSLALGSVGNGIFFMITGYFYSQKNKISLKKIFFTTLFLLILL